MKKKLLVLVAMLLCIVTVLSACGETVKFKKIVADEYVDQNPTLTKAEAVTLTGDVKDAQDDLLYLEGLNDDGKPVYTVYNMAENKTVWTATVTDEKTSYDVELMDGYYEDIAWFAVVTTVEGEGDAEDTATADIYDQKGTKVVSFDAEEVEPDVMLDLIKVDTKVYRIAEDGTIAEAFEMGALAEMPEVDAKYGDYYLLMADDFLFGYDEELQLVFAHRIPAYATNPIAIALNNGNVLVQFTCMATWDAEDYSFIDNSGNKVVLTSLLINAKNGKIKELDLDFVILAGSSRTDDDLEYVYFDELNEDIENVALVSYIVDERVVGPMTGGDSYSNVMDLNTCLISLSNKGKDKGILDATLVGQAMLPSQVDEDLWAIYTITGQAYLVNGKGKVVAEISDVNYVNAAYIVSDGKLYNFALEVVLDFEEKELEMMDLEHYRLNRGMFFVDEDGVITLFANGESKTIVAKDADREVIAVRDNYFIVEDNTGDDTKYEIYNDVGTLLYTVEKASGYANAYYASNNVIVLTGLESDDKDVVIRLSVA